MRKGQVVYDGGKCELIPNAHTEKETIISQSIFFEE